MTITEDLKTQIDTDYSGTPALTIHIFMKTDENETRIEPPVIPDDTVIGIILGSAGIPIRATQKKDLMVYEGDFLLYSKTYADMKDCIDNIKDVGDGVAGSDLSFNIPAIHGEKKEKRYIANMRFKWEKLVNRY